MIKISAVFAAYNGIAFTKQCMNFLRIVLEGVPHEIIAVDNGSTDGTKEWLAGQEDITLIRNEENLGLAAAWNQGKKAAEGEAVLFFHNDVIFARNSVRIMRDTLFSRPDIGMVGPITNKCFYMFNQGVNTVDIKTFSGVQRAANQLERLKPQPVLFLESFCVMIRRETLEAIGDFDERYFPASLEDADYGLRLSQAGYFSVMAPTYVHHCEGSYKENGISYDDIYQKNENLFHEKWGVAPQYSMIVRTDILRYIDSNKEELSLLDVGCACGANLMWLKYHHPKARLRGVELDEKSAAIAKWFAPVEAVDIEKLERKEWEESFDYIILADIVEHLKDPWKFLKHMKNLLKPDGKIIVSIPNVCHASNLWDMLHGNWEYEDAGILDRTHLRFFTKNSFIKCLEQAGLRMESIQSKKIVKDHYREFLESILSVEDIDISREELEAIQWIFVASRADAPGINN